LAARSDRTLEFVSLESLAPLGVDVSRYESFDYTATQALAAAAHFLEFDGLLAAPALKSKGVDGRVKHGHDEVGGWVICYDGCYKSCNEQNG
jgi:hypothetical protein